jgi:hypothetical protein
MYDQDIERIANLLHAERLTRMQHDLRIREAEALCGQRGERVIGARCRAAIARLLIMLARRIMPAAQHTATTHRGAISG